MAQPARAPILDKTVTSPVSSRSGFSQSWDLSGLFTTRPIYLDCSALTMDRNAVSKPPELATPAAGTNIAIGMGFLLDVYGYTTNPDVEIRVFGAVSSGMGSIGTPTVFAELTILYCTPGVAMVLQGYRVACNWLRVDFVNMGVPGATVYGGAWLRPV